MAQNLQDVGLSKSLFLLREDGRLDWTTKRLLAYTPQLPNHDPMKLSNVPSAVTLDGSCTRWIQCKLPNS
jgi:hypothetical protein